MKGLLARSFRTSQAVLQQALNLIWETLGYQPPLLPFSRCSSDESIPSEFSLRNQDVSLSLKAVNSVPFQFAYFFGFTGLRNLFVNRSSTGTFTLSP